MFWFRKNSVKEVDVVVDVVDDVVDEKAFELFMGFIMNDPLAFCMGKSFETTGEYNLPTKKSLDRHHIKIVKFDVPVDGDYFLARDNCIQKVGTTTKGADVNIFGGRRFILDKQ